MDTECVDNFSVLAKFDSKNWSGNLALIGICNGEVTGGTAREIMYCFIYDKFIVPEDEGSWVCKYFPKQWQNDMQSICHERERQVEEILES